MRYERKDRYTMPDTPTDVLKLALEKEKSSFDFYKELIKKTRNPILKSLLSKLKAAELGHILKIKHALEK